MGDAEWKAALADLAGRMSAAVEALTSLVHEHRDDVTRAVQALRDEQREFQRESSKDRATIREAVARIDERTKRQPAPHSSPRKGTVVTGGAVLAAACIGIGTAFGDHAIEALMEVFSR